MALLSKQELASHIASIITQCGWHAVWLSDSTEHPFRVRAVRDGQAFNLRIYMWNLTHGGGEARPPDEYRIQVTGVEAFQEEPDGSTLILGWWEEAGVYAAFDVAKHRGKLGFSPSIQIREESLRSAYEHGISTQMKGSREIAVAFRPDLFMHYVENQRSLHGFAESEHDLSVLEAVAINPEAVDDDAIQSVAESRRNTVVTVRRILRATNFRERVLSAYQRKCAVCTVQLGLVEAAHIIPVAVEGSTDKTWNGVAFCPNHHKAYDAALITIADEYRVLVSSTRVKRLEAENLHGGIEAFRQGLRPYIFIPPEPSLRPSPHCLRRGREIRGWAE